MKSKKEILMQPNNIIKGRYSCTAMENKLFYKIIFNAQKLENNSDFITIMTTDELKQFIKRKNDLTNKNISDMLITLHQTILEFDYFDENKNDLVTYKSGLIGESKYYHSTDTYEIKIHEILYNHITDFIKMQSRGNGYTPLNLDLLFKFKSTYSQRLYTFFRLWSRENKEIDVKYSLNDLRKFLKIKDDIYSEYKHFKQKIIKRALKEINEEGNMKVEIKQEIRKGRKVDKIVFSVIDYEPRKYFDKKDNELLELIEPIETKKEALIEKDKKVNDSFDSEIIDLKASVNDLFIPEETIFTKGTLRSFKKDFKSIDFKNEYMERAFDDALSITMERDDVDIIKVSSYKFFKSILDNKIAEYKIEEKEDIEHKKEMDMYW